MNQLLGGKRKHHSKKKSRLKRRPSYRDSRPSPSVSATKMNEGDIAKGNDGNKWVIKLYKNGVKRWIRLKENSKSKKKSYKNPTKRAWAIYEPSYDKNSLIDNMVPKDIPKYMKKNRITKIFLEKIIPLLKKNKIKVYLVPQKADSFWNDYWDSYISDYYTDSEESEQYIAPIIYMNSDGSIAQERPIKIHFQLSVDKSQFVFDTFTKYLEGYYVWSGNQNRTMFIEFKRKSNYDAKPRKKIEMLSNYPMIGLKISINKKNRRNKVNFFDVNGSPINILESKELGKLESLEKDGIVNTLDKSWDMYDMNLKFYGINNLPKVLKIIGEIQKKNKLTGKGFAFTVTNSAYFLKTENDASSKENYKDIVNGKIIN